MPVKKNTDPKPKAKASTAKGPLKTYSGTGKGGSVDRAPYKGKPEAKATGAAGKAVNMNTAKAKAFDAKKKKMASEYAKNNPIKARGREMEEGFRNFQKAGTKVFEKAGNQAIETVKYLKSPSTYERSKKK